jgi:hypothetical protein
MPVSHRRNVDVAEFSAQGRVIEPMTVHTGDRVSVIAGAHRGCTGRVVAEPTPAGTVHLHVRLTPTQQALLVVRLEDVAPMEPSGR